MNDCVWSWVEVCEGNCKCDKYIPINSKEGREIDCSYDQEIKAAIAPIQNQWKRYFEEDSWKENIDE